MIHWQFGYPVWTATKDTMYIDCHPAPTQGFKSTSAIWEFCFWALIRDPWTPAISQIEWQQFGFILFLRSCGNARFFSNVVPGWYEFYNQECIMGVFYKYLKYKYSIAIVSFENNFERSTTVFAHLMAAVERYPCTCMNAVRIIATQDVQNNVLQITPSNCADAWTHICLVCITFRIAEFSYLLCHIYFLCKRLIWAFVIPLWLLL